MQIGSIVMVPRTGGGTSLGKVLELWGDNARVEYKIGPTLHGKPAPEVLQKCYGYKTLPITELKEVQV